MKKAPLVDRFAAVQTIYYPQGGHPVGHTTAALLGRQFGLELLQAAERPRKGEKEGFHVSLAGGPWEIEVKAALQDERPWMWIRLTSEGTGELVASAPSFLYALARLLVEDKLSQAQREALSGGLLLRPCFAWNRSHNDYVLTQTARTARNFDPETYLRRLAACGFTHVEVNGLATPFPHEPGVPDEYYSPFYTYCPGLNQFVDTPLTRGLYPPAYLRANLNRLKRLAALCRRYGLQPGLLCFEPRTLPEHFFRQHPTLRGARVDHPFRSRLPRYTLAQDHPATRDHYRRLMQNLMHEAPELAYLSVWSNDSGAGFEHTASLYVGRNGGPYLIREWRGHEDIAEAAGESVLRFLRLLQGAGAGVNPDFEVVLRMEPFRAEHETIMADMGSGLSIEAPSLQVRGYDLPYRHLRYPEQKGVAGSIHHVGFEADERDRLKAFRREGFEPHLYYAAGPAFNLEPLLGIPFPRLLHRKLKALREMDARRISTLGGLLNTAQAPYWPNPEVIRAVQFGAGRALGEVLHEAAGRWTGPDRAVRLVALWEAVDEAVSYLPIVPLYSSFGFVWLRTWVRPLVPDIEAIPKEERLYYERFMVSTPNNPNINDLGRDVLFRLITEEAGRRMARQFDENVLPRLEKVLKEAQDAAEQTTEQAAASAQPVFVDLRDRIRALRCWATTQRNTCAWVAGVHGYLHAETTEEQADCRACVRDMAASELANARDLLDLWESSTTEFMLVSEIGETGFIYGENFGDLLRRKIRLTEEYGDHEPCIDQDIIWRL